LGIALLAENLDLLGDWTVPIWSLALWAGGLLFLAVFFSERDQWWALIPGLVLPGIGTAVYLGERGLVAEHAVGTIILATIGLPFLLIFLSDRSQWWALIPAFALAGSACGVFLEGTGAISDEAVAGVIVGGVSLGFLSIYFFEREQWWALIPGGILALIALLMLLATATEYILPLALILVGILLLRGVLGRGRRSAQRGHPTPSSQTLYNDSSFSAMSSDTLATSNKTSTAERKQLPTLEEQIQAAIVEEQEAAKDPSKAKTGKPGPEPKAPSAKEVNAQATTKEAEPSDGIPPAPEIPEAPEAPTPPNI
jgi:hypothetical protein